MQTQTLEHLSLRERVRFARRHSNQASPVGIYRVPILETSATALCGPTELITNFTGCEKLFFKETLIHPLQLFNSDSYSKSAEWFLDVIGCLWSPQVHEGFLD